MPNFIDGEVILVNKPLEWTSFDVVKKIKYPLRLITGDKKIKVGHAGTLDPLASGLLIVCTGKKTKTIESIQNQEKEYTGIIRLGGTTPSFDLETEVENQVEIGHLSEEDILEAVREMIGEQDQFPPKFSAKKINGKRAYKMARKGQDFKVKSKLISIYSFKIEKFNLPDLHFRVRCSKGTYIRSIANDLGQKLNVGGYLKSLKRTRIGDFSIDKAYGVEELTVYLQEHRAF